jgi:hypothetical protein
MPFNERINFASFVDNQEQIESDWDSDFGDRKIELVFIGQNLDRHAISKMLQKCLISDSELSYWKNEDFQKADNWPIQQYN